MDEKDDLEAFIASGLRLLGISVSPEWHAAIRLHLSISLGYVHNVIAFPLPDEAEPASVFTP
jgi:1-carboxybiuret hydrolase subunit AtzG-like